MSAWSRPAVVAPLLGFAAGGVSLQMAGYRLAGSDAGALLTAASRILDGGVFYRDIDSYPFPGAAYLLAGSMRVFGETLGVARGLAAVFFVVTVLSLYAVAVRVLGARRAAVFGASLLAFKLLAWPSFTAYTYWDVSLAFACAACAALVAWRPGGTRRALVASGLLAGLAVVSKQSLGIPLAAAGCAVLALRAGASPRARVSGAAVFAAAAALPLLTLAAAFAGQGLLGPMIESGLLRPFSDYLPASSTSFLEPLLWWRFGELRGVPGLAYSSEPLWAMLVHRQLPGELWYAPGWWLNELLSRLVYTSVPVVLGLAAWRWWKGRRELAWASFAFAPLAAAVFASAFPRADFAHVISVYPVVLLLLFALRRATAPSPVEVAAVAVVLAFCAAATGVQQRALTHELRLERASLRISPDKTWIESAVRYVTATVPAGEPFFVYGHEAYYYFLADRYSPWRYSQLYPGQGGGDGGEAIVAALSQRPPRIILRGALHFPRATPIPESLPKLDAWIREGYEPDPQVFERYPPAGRRPRAKQFEVLRRRD